MDREIRSRARNPVGAENSEISSSSFAHPLCKPIASATVPAPDPGTSDDHFAPPPLAKRRKRTPRSLPAFRPSGLPQEDASPSVAQNGGGGSEEGDRISGVVENEGRGGDEGGDGSAYSTDSALSFSDSDFNSQDAESDEVSLDDVDDYLLSGSATFDTRKDEGSFTRGLFGCRERKKKKKLKKRNYAPAPEGKNPKHRRKKTAAAESQMSPEIETLLANANNAYLEKNVSQAISLLEEVIQKAPGLHDPFHLLGLIYEEEMGDRVRALDYYFLGAQLVANDGDLWRRVGVLANELGCTRQAMYCYRRALQVNDGINHPLDEAAAFDLANCYIASGDFRRAARRLRKLFDNHPDDPFLGRELAKCLHQGGLLEQAIEVLESSVCAPITREDWQVYLATQGGAGGTPGVHVGAYLLKSISRGGETADSPPDGEGARLMVYDAHSLNMLSEVYVEAGKFVECERLLSDVVSEETMDAVPSDLLVKFAASQIYAKKEQKTVFIDRAFDILLSSETSREAFTDLYLLLAEALYTVGEFSGALKLYTEVAALSSVRRDASIWVKIARCQLRKDQAASGVTADSVGEADDAGKPLEAEDADARLMLSQILSRLGHDSANRRVALLAMPSAQAGGKEAFEPPPAIPAHKRQEILTRLQEEMMVLLPLCMSACREMESKRKMRTDCSPRSSADFSSSMSSRPPPDPSCQEGRNPNFEKERAKWIRSFLELVEDSELDTQRVFRYNIDRRLERTELDFESQQALLGELGVDIATEKEVGSSTTTPSFPATLTNSGPQGGAGTPQQTALFDGYDGQTGARPSETPVPRMKTRKSGSKRGSTTDPDVLSQSLPPSVRRPTKQVAINISQHFKVKSILGLVSCEDVLGWKGYCTFLERGLGVIMRSAGLFRAAVEMLEAVITTKRTVRAHQYDLDRRLFQQRLKKLCLRLAVEGGMYRIALSHIREKYLKRPDSSHRALQVFGRLLFCGPFAHTTIGGLSTSVEREAILENRSWCIRQLLQRPRSYALTLLTGHFCTLSGRWPLAIAEYIRAHRLQPRDELTTLSLGTAYLNFATSRSVEDRHGTVLRGFAVMSTYARRRLRSAEIVAENAKKNYDKAKRRHAYDDTLVSESEGGSADVRKTLASYILATYKAEVQYNVARAFHHLNILYHALPLYLQCLAQLPTHEQIGTLQRRARPFQLPAPLLVDIPQLRCCAAHNISTIYLERGSTEEAAGVSLGGMTWGD